MDLASHTSQFRQSLFTVCKLESLPFSVILPSEHRLCLHIVTLDYMTASPSVDPANSDFSHCYHGLIHHSFLLITVKLTPFQILVSQGLVILHGMISVSESPYLQCEGSVGFLSAFLSLRIKTLSQQRSYLPNPAPFQVICFYSWLNPAGNSSTTPHTANSPHVKGK